MHQGGKPIGDDERFSVEVRPDEVILTCRAAKKEDQGRYSVTLKNPKGTDTAYVNVTVVGKPGSPEGPIEVSKITPDSCKLAWQPPKVLPHRFFIIFRRPLCNP